MYLFIYKTTHKNGKFYIGRHGALLLEDGYLGSGKWVKSIKDKSSLTREILCFASSMEELHSLEEYYIDLHWNDPLCMNNKKASLGSTSEDAKRRVALGTHNFLKREDGSSFSSDRVKNGTHNLLKRNDGSSVMSDRTIRGENPFSKRENGSSLASDRVKSGTNPFLIRGDGTSLGKEVCHERLKNGTHPFQKRRDGTSLASDMVLKGNHPFLKFKGMVSCFNKKGELQRISKEEYMSQIGDAESKEFAHITSKEGRKRRELFLQTKK